MREPGLSRPRIPVPPRGHRSQGRESNPRFPRHETRRGASHLPCKQLTRPSDAAAHAACFRRSDRGRRAGGTRTRDHLVPIILCLRPARSGRMNGEASALTTELQPPCLLVRPNAPTTCGASRESRLFLSAPHAAGRLERRRACIVFKQLGWALNEKRPTRFLRRWGVRADPVGARTQCTVPSHPARLFPVAGRYSGWATLLSCLLCLMWLLGSDRFGPIPSAASAHADRGATRRRPGVRAPTAGTHRRWMRSDLSICLNIESCLFLVSVCRSITPKGEKNRAADASPARPWPG